MRHEGKCIFCDENDPDSKEDFWPKWLQKEMPNIINSTKHLTSIQMHHENLGKIQETKNFGIFNNPGKPSTKVLRVVCAKCNNEWMSTIQSKAKPIILKLMKEKILELDQNEQKILASWATMFSMVYDFSDLKTQSITKEERSYFFRTKTPPSKWLIFIGQIDDDLTIAKSWRRSFSLSYQKEASFNAQTSTFCLGTIFFHVFGTTHSHRLNTINIADLLEMQHIWPYQNKLLKLNKFVHTGESFNKVATLMSENIFQKTDIKKVSKFITL